MEAQPALVRADRVGELDAVAAVDLDVVVVVEPADAEADDPVGLGEPLEDLVLAVPSLSSTKGITVSTTSRTAWWYSRLTRRTLDHAIHELIDPISRRRAHRCPT
jgi:hypothetical protein